MQDIEEKLRELRGVLGLKADKLRLAYLFETDPEAKRVIESSINVLHATHFSDNAILLQPPPAHIAAGDYPLGTLVFNGVPSSPFGLRESELPQHVLIAGRSGSGKSNAMMLLAQQFNQLGKPFMLFSFKREYRGLLSGPDTPLIFTCGRDAAPFSFNPLEVPPGTDKDTWINLLAEALATTYFAGEGVMAVLRQGLSYVYDRFPNPKPKHLKVWLDEKQMSQRREGDWFASTRRIIDALCFGSLGKVVNSDSPISLKDLLSKKVILELDNFNDDDRTFLIQVVMRYVYRYALENFPRNECKYMLLIDEAHHLFLKKAADLQGKETWSDAILRMVRECSVGFVLADQHPSLISLPALGNTFCTIAMNLKTRADCLAVGNAMLLTEEQRDWLGRLPVGSAIVKLQDRYVEPFQVRIPYVKSSDMVTDEEIASYMAPYLPTPSAVSALGTPEIRPIPPVPVTEEIAPVGLSESEKAFLISVLEHPFVGTGTRYRDLGLSTRNGQATKDTLIQRGYLLPVTIFIQQNTMQLFELTASAKSWLASAGHPVREEKREGGMEHRFGVWYVSRFYRDHGFKTEKEKQTSGGKFIDLIASREDVSIANEIETGKSDILENVVNAFDGGWTDVRVIATNQDAFQKCRRVLTEFKCPEGKRLSISYLLPNDQTAETP